LLITLRQPQLARTLDEEALSRALSEALAPLGQKIIDDVAESMRGLEADREQLESHRAADEAIQAFLTTYGRYPPAAGWSFASGGSRRTMVLPACPTRDAGC
jgi:hypothetical protein